MEKKGLKPPTRICFLISIHQAICGSCRYARYARYAIHGISCGSALHRDAIPAHSDFSPKSKRVTSRVEDMDILYPKGSMYAIYGNSYHPYGPYTPNVSIYTIHGCDDCIYIYMIK